MSFKQDNGRFIYLNRYYAANIQNLDQLYNIKTKQIDNVYFLYINHVVVQNTIIKTFTMYLQILLQLNVYRQKLIKKFDNHFSPKKTI